MVYMYSYLLTTYIRTSDSVLEKSTVFITTNNTANCHLSHAQIFPWLISQKYLNQLGARFNCTERLQELGEIVF